MKNLTPLQRGQQRLAEMRAKGCTPERLDPLEKARRNPTSLRKAITAKCWDCIGAGADPNPREAIRECQIADCPLWPVRPWQARRKNHELQMDKSAPALDGAKLPKG